MKVKPFYKNDASANRVTGVLQPSKSKILYTDDGKMRLAVFMATSKLLKIEMIWKSVYKCNYRRRLER